MGTTQPNHNGQVRKRPRHPGLRSRAGGMPKDEADQHILLKSAALLLPAGSLLSEKEVNERLQVWLTQVCVIQNFDRVTLRRWLVDTGYLARSSNGAEYRVSTARPDLFEAAVDQIDILETIRSARDEMERRKQAFLARSKGA